MAKKKKLNILQYNYKRKTINYYIGIHILIILFIVKKNL